MSDKVLFIIYDILLALCIGCLIWAVTAIVFQN